MKTERKLLTGTLLALCGALLALCIVLAAGWSKAAKTDAALPEVRNSGTAIQWKYSDEADWRDLVALSELRGAVGENGKDGANGKDGKDGANGENGTDGTIKVAIDAINAAGAPHCFLSVTKWGHSAIVNTSGNGDCHIILRGGKEPNYSAKHVAEVKEGLNKAGLPAQVMIDFSHANSSKQFKKQMDVCADVCQQIAGGEKAIIGVMVESHLVEGNQSLESGEPLAYGKSITDACIGWEDTDALLRQLANAVKARRG